MLSVSAFDKYNPNFFRKMKSSKIRNDFFEGNDLEYNQRDSVFRYISLNTEVSAFDICMFVIENWLTIECMLDNKISKSMMNEISTLVSNLNTTQSTILDIAPHITQQINEHATKSSSVCVALHRCCLIENPELISYANSRGGIIGIITKTDEYECKCTIYTFINLLEFLMT